MSFETFYKINSDGSGKCLNDTYPTIESLMGRRAIYNESKYYVMFEQDIEKHINSYPPQQRTYHEVIFNTRQKLRFDIDASVQSLSSYRPHITSLQDKFESIILDFIVAIAAQGESCYSKNDFVDRIIICESSDPKIKYSSHIIIDAYCVLNNEQAKEFAHRVFESMQSDSAAFADKGVYKSIQNFRILGSHKTNDARVKKIMDVKRITDAIDTDAMMSDAELPADYWNRFLFQRVNQPERINFNSTLIGYIDGCEPLWQIPLTHKKNDPQTTVDLSDDEHALLQPLILDLCRENGLLENHRFRSRSNGFYVFNRSHSDHCEICDRPHDKDNTLFVFAQHNGNGRYTVRKGCMRYKSENNGQSRSVVLGHVEIPVENASNTVQLPPKPIQFAIAITDELAKTINDFINTTLKGAYSWDRREITSRDTITMPVSDAFTKTTRACPCCVGKSHTDKVTGLIKYSEYRGEYFISFICHEQQYLKNRTSKINYIAITCINADGKPCMSKSQMMSREGMIKIALDDNKAVQSKLFDLDYANDDSHGLHVECVNVPDIPAIKIAPSVVIVSNKGTSKTVQIINMIKRLQGRTIVWTTHRISLADNISARLASEGIATRYYKDIDDRKPLKKGEIAIIQADSLKRVIDQVSLVDVFIIDELLSVSARMRNPDEKINASVRVYFSLMRTAGIVIYSDAYLDRSLFESVVLPSINKQKEILANKKHDKNSIKYESQSYILQNGFKRETYTKVCITTLHIDLMAKMYEDLDQGARFTCSSTSLDDLMKVYNALCKKYPNKKDKIALITGESEKAFKKAMSEYVNKSWLNYDVILYTSVISAGVSFEVAGHFKRLYSIITRGSCLIQEAAQSFSRVRLPMVKEITILLDISSEKQQDIKDIEIYQQKHLDDLNQVYPTRIWELDNMTRLQACFLRYRDITDRQLLRSLLMLLEIDGVADIQAMRENKGDRLLNKQFIKDNKQTDEGFITSLANAQQIEGDKFAEWIRESQIGYALEKDQVLSMYRYRIQNQLSCDQASIPINKDSYKIYQNKSKMRMIRLQRAYSWIKNELGLKEIQQNKLIDVDDCGHWNILEERGIVYDKIIHHGRDRINARYEMADKARNTLARKQDIRLCNTIKDFDMSLIIAANRSLDILGFEDRDLSVKIPTRPLDVMRVIDVVDTYNQYHESKIQVSEHDDQIALTRCLEKVLKNVYALKLLADDHFSFNVDCPAGWEYDLFTFEYRLKPVVVAPVAPKEYTAATILRYAQQKRKDDGVKKDYTFEINHEAKTYRVIGKQGGYIAVASLRVLKNKDDVLRKRIEDELKNYKFV
jgi:hypothetical protein